MKAVICSAANPRADFRKFKAPAIMEPIIPGRAAAAFCASLPNNLIKALSLFFNQFLNCSGFEGGFELPPELLLPPVKLVIIVSNIKPKDIKIAVIVIPCSLNR